MSQTKVFHTKIAFISIKLQKMLVFDRKSQVKMPIFGQIEFSCYLSGRAWAAGVCVCVWVCVGVRSV
jgi:hypothetical protein